jgi:hypothetical protein
MLIAGYDDSFQPSKQRTCVRCGTGAPIPGREALAAAGLPGIETAAPARVASGDHRRAAVLREVHNCWTALRRVPTASEFFRWRLAQAPDGPSQAALYRLFPGGWSAVVEALPPRALIEWDRSASGEALQPLSQSVHVASPPRKELAGVPDVQPRSVDQLGHEGVAGDEVAAWQGE